jgi:hypothetical protein
MRKAQKNAVCTVTLATIWSLFLLLGARDALPDTAWPAAQIIVGAFETFAILVSLYAMWTEVRVGVPATESNRG